MALFGLSLFTLFSLTHIALLSTLCSAADPVVSFDFRVSYITASPLGVPQRVRLSLLFHLALLCFYCCVRKRAIFGLHFGFESIGNAIIDFFFFMGFVVLCNFFQ